FYPDPVLFQMMEAYDVVESVPMNGFDYQVLRPDPDWPDRRVLVDALHALEPGQVLDGEVPAPDWPVEAWLAEVMGQVAWTQVGDWQQGRVLFEREGEQIRVGAAQAEDAVRVQVLPES
ncbi:MAG: hypothetical protein JXN59_12565, partial [Anaerolineae bacterium]|nr:hypothetical protein [Anaerolineae bacterium]